MSGFLSGADPAPFSTEQLSTNHGGCTLCLVHIATLMQRTSLYESLFDVLRMENTQICSSQETWAVPQIQRHILKGRNSEKLPHDESPELHSSCHTFYVLMVVSNSLRSTLVCCTFQHFCPQTPHMHRHCMLHMRRQSPALCPSPLHQSRDPLLVLTRVITLVVDKWIQK